MTEQAKAEKPATKLVMIGGELRCVLRESAVGTVVEIGGREIYVALSHFKAGPAA